MKRKFLAACAAGLMLVPGMAFAHITIDGLRDGDYGAPRALQASPTRFGDSNLGWLDWANGSELDAGYAVVHDGALYILLTGNLESNFNKLELFIDCHGGGQNVLRNDNRDIDFNGLNRMAGLRFDADFSANYWFSCTGGDIGGGIYRMFANFTEILTDGGEGEGGYLGNTFAGSNGVLIDGFNPWDIRCTIDNSNMAGVSDSEVGDPGAVASGIEIRIPLEALGNPSGPIKICAFINGQGHDFASNQFLGDPTLIADNLGEPSAIDLTTIEGNQYFTAATDAVDVLPTGLDVQHGDLLSGGLAELQAEDGQVLDVRQRAGISVQTPNVGVVVTGNGGQGAVSSLDIRIRAATTGLPFQNILYRVEAFDYDSNGYSQLYNGAPSGSGQQVYTFSLTGAPADALVSETGGVNLRLRWFDRGSAVPAWRALIDHVKWTIGR